MCCNVNLFVSSKHRLLLAIARNIEIKILYKSPLRSILRSQLELSRALLCLLKHLSAQAC